MIEVPEELIERAALTLQDHHTVEEKWRTDHWEYRCACAEICDLADVLNHKAEQALAAVLPDLIAAIEAEYEDVGWWVPGTGAHVISLPGGPERDQTRKRRLLVRRVP